MKVNSKFMAAVSFAIRPRDGKKNRKGAVESGFKINQKGVFMTTVHVVLLYAGILGLLLVVLSFNMMKNWVRSVGEEAQSDPDLRRAEALVGSFTDYVPLTLLLTAGIESFGAPAWVVHALGILLVAARLMHAFGSNRTRGADVLRFLGAQATYLVLTIASFGCLYFYAMPSLALVF